MRGERRSVSKCGPSKNGSSPHARGTLEGMTDFVRNVRFIPACAGNAGEAQRKCASDGVHPRMRGERSAGGDANVSSYGSSPHARGTPRAFFPAADGVRFIPACAGNAWPPASAVAGSSVHPRMRGERSGGPSSASSFSGSSPHARGTLDFLIVTQAPGRFIPACAGNAPRRVR